MNCNREFDYRPTWTTILLIGLFFGFGAVVLGIKAHNNDRGLIIAHIVELEQSGATIFYWVIFSGAMGFVAMALILAGDRMVFRRRLVFGPKAIKVPVSRWSAAEQEIAYDEIQYLSTTEVGGQSFLYVTHHGGKYTIAAAMLPSRAAFEEVCELLAKRVRDSKVANERKDGKEDIRD